MAMLCTRPQSVRRRTLTRLASSTALSGCAELRTACCVCRTCRACSTALPLAIWMRKEPFILRALLHAAPAPSAQHPTLQVTTFRNRNLRMPDDADMSAELQATYEDGVSSAAAQHAGSGENTHEACLSGHVHRGIALGRWGNVPTTIAAAYLMLNWEGIKDFFV